MAYLTVWKFNDADGAKRVLGILKELQKQEIIEIIDAASVYWPYGKKKPKTKQMIDLTKEGALDGAFWGMLFGLIFFVPILGLAVGAMGGALSGHFKDYGIDDDFIKEVRAQVIPGTSALFLMTGPSTADDKIDEALKGEKMELIKSNLSREQEAILRERFSHD